MRKLMKSRSHELVLKVTFNKAITAQAAARAAANAIHGKFYSDGIEDEVDGWQTFRVTSIRRPGPQRRAVPASAARAARAGVR